MKAALVGLRGSRLFLSEHGLRLICRLDLGKEIPQLLIMIHGKEDARNLEGPFQIHIIIGRAGADGVLCEFCACTLGRGQGLKRITLRKFHRDVVMFRVSVLIVNGIRNYSIRLDVAVGQFNFNWLKQ